MALILDGTTGVPVTTVTGTLPVANGGTGVTTKTGTGAVVLGTSPSISGAVMTTMASSVITSGTAVASTSGTSIDFTSIPSWVKRITVMLSGVSTSSTSLWQIQLGSGSVTTSGYVGATTYVVNAATSTSNATSGFVINNSTANTGSWSAQLILSLLGSNKWAISFGCAQDISARLCAGAGSITLAGTLDRIRFTTVNGTDTFTAGSVNLLYE
jgi:hypothetical protein